MSIEDSLQADLAADVTVRATVSTDPVTAIAPLNASERLAFPRIILVKESDIPTYSNAGAHALSKARFMIECQSKGQKAIAQIEATRDAVKNHLSGIGNNASIGSPTVSRTINRLFITDEYDTPYPAIHGEELGVMAKTLEIELDYV